MSRESDFIAALRHLPLAAGARGLADDAAVMAAPIGRDLVITHDMIVEGVHFLPDDPAGDVAWKLVAVNLSDLAAKGAQPMGVVMGYMLGQDPQWELDFIAGLGRALSHFETVLLGGDTVRSQSQGPRVLGLTAIGQAAEPVPDRRLAKANDGLWVTGTIGDAGLGLAMAKGDKTGPRALLKRYRLPMPRLQEGQLLRTYVAAMADVSDGLLIDSIRMAQASGLGVVIDLDAVPLSHDYQAVAGTDRMARLQAVTSGDDYELLFAFAGAELPEGVTATRIGHFTADQGICLQSDGQLVPLPAKTGYEH